MSIQIQDDMRLTEVFVIGAKAKSEQRGIQSLRDAVAEYEALEKKFECLRTQYRKAMCRIAAYQEAFGTIEHPIGPTSKFVEDVIANSDSYEIACWVEDGKGRIRVEKREASEVTP